MKTVVVGECHADHIFTEEDATVPTETEFEYHCIKALACVYPEYHCIRFEVHFAHLRRSWKPDLALVARDFSHWFIIEVELVTHSFELHVFPQVKAFQYGDIDADDAAKRLASALGIQLGQAHTIVAHVPRCVVVVANRHQPDWAHDLSLHDIQFLSVATYRARNGTTALEVSGRLVATQEILGWATYSATDRSFRLSAKCPVPKVDRLQLEDTYGTVSWWIVTRVEDAIWLTKEFGTSEFEPEQVVLIVRTYQGKLSIRIP
jgi:hypothetical protein